MNERYTYYPMVKNIFKLFISVINGCRKEIECISHAEMEPSGILILQKFNKLVKHA